jgi:hypothetical protein
MTNTKDRGGSVARLWNRGPVAIGLVTIGLLLAATPAGATTIYTHNFLGSFDGSGSKGPGNVSTGPLNTVGPLAINQSTGSVIVWDVGLGTLDKFDPSGNPQAFASLGAGINSLNVPYLGGLPIYGDPDVTVDNSGTASQGRIYEFQEGQATYAYAPDGSSLSGNFPLGSFGDMCGASVDSQGNYWWTAYGQGTFEYDSSGTPLNKSVAPEGNCHLAIDSSQPGSHPTSGYFYVANWNGAVHAFNQEGTYEYTVDEEGASYVAVDPSTGNIFVDHGDHITEWAPSDPVGAPHTPGAKISTFGEPAPGFTGLESGSCYPTRGVAVNGVTHYVYVSDCGRVDIFGPGQAEIIPTVTTDEADVAPTTAVLHGHATTDSGGDTNGCYFEYGLTSSYGNTAPCASPSGPIHDADGNVAVTSATVSGLVQGSTYHFRLVVTNPNGAGYGADQIFKPQGPPEVSAVGVSEVNTDGARITATVDPSGGDTRYQFQWGQTNAYGSSAPVPDQKLPDNRTIRTESIVLKGLQPGATYHYRVLAHNDLGSGESGDHTFTTFGEDESENDPCPNAHARQQTGAALLADCRAYELVSAGSTNGYNVQSDLVLGQVPLPAFPSADGRVLYSVHFGTILSAGGNPTNFGLDPYLATRTTDGWTTRYVGIDADGTPTEGPFASPLGAADASLDTFAFAGSNLCAPCFSDGTTGIPLRMAGGSLTQGMRGSLDPGVNATTDGLVAKPLSANGTHLVFGSTSKFEPDGNSNGDVSIYDRNLLTGVTHVVSKTPAGANLPCPGGAGTCHSPGDPNGIGELDISSDGSRILLGQLMSTDTKGNDYWHLYMNIGDSGSSVDLTPNPVAGAVYDGMTADGSKVFFTTTDKLSPVADTDSSADIYEADIASNGSVTWRLVSSGTGGSGNVDACSPVANHASAHWNSVGATDCSALAFAGGAGIASGDGTVFFLSPEKLDGSGVQNQPNLFVARPGQGPDYVTTLEADSAPVSNALTQSAVHTYSDFQVTPSGEDAVFTTKLSPNGYDNRGHSEVYRYDVGSDSLDCASCAPTNAFGVTDAQLARFGLSVTDGGKVFFTSGDPLALRDSNGRRDVYQWDDGEVQLVSTGTGNYDSGLFTASDDGTDVYFFTHDTLVPDDQNAQLVKLYDARTDGGFPRNPPPVPCQASDECHGPGTQVPPPPAVGTYVGTGGNGSAKAHKKQRHHRKHHRHPRNSRRRHG